MNTILLQKILDLLKDNLTGVGTFIKSVFVHDPQDGQVLGYDAETGKWENMYVDEISLEVTKVTETANIVSFSDAGADLPLKSLKANINDEDGANEVVVTRCGKNLFSQSSVSGTKNEVVYFSLPAGEYTISTLVTSSDTEGTKSLILFTYEDGTTTNIRIDRNTRQSDTIIFTKGITQVTFYAGYNSSQSADDTFTYSDIQIETGDSATDYVPYSGDTYTVTLPSSVSSGYVDIITGQGMSGDTPFTVTPVIINSTSGVNNIFASSGTVRAEYYTATAGDIKSLVCITEDITSEITKNTTDFSDILLKVSRNNKVVSVEIYSATTAEAVNETFLSDLPKPAMNCKVLLVNTTLGEDGTILGTLKTTGELEIATPGAKSFGGLITYVAK